MFEEKLRKNLLWVTGREKLPEGETMRDILGRLDGFASEENLPERLAHYLSRRSYVKALEWLDDPDMPHRV